MEKRTAKSSYGVFVNLITLLVVVCVLSLFAGVAYTKAGQPEDSSSAVSQAGEWQVIRMRVTGYCPCSKCCGQYADGITASGHKIQSGDVFVAADKRFSFGTEMIIDGYGDSEPVKVLDRGGAIKGNKLDAFFHTHAEALEWGVRLIDVKIRID
ncbi:MAG: 3D domain-containing protein [Planctomycetota bacterium]